MLSLLSSLLVLFKDAEQAEMVFIAEQLANHPPGCSLAEQCLDPLGSVPVVIRCLAEAADAVREYINPLQNFVLSKHRLLNVWNVRFGVTEKLRAEEIMYLNSVLWSRRNIGGYFKAAAVCLPCLITSLSHKERQKETCWARTAFHSSL